MKTFLWLLLPALILSLALPVSPAIAASKETTRVETAGDVMGKIMEIPEKEIPPSLLANAQGIAIIPGVIKVGFVVGGQYGKGTAATEILDGKDVKTPPAAAELKKKLSKYAPAGSKG